jgi:hypothetical protein
MEPDGSTHFSSTGAYPEPDNPIHTNPSYLSKDASTLLALVLVLARLRRVRIRIFTRSVYRL